ncbi:MAG: redoxin family protein [Hyphomicrobium sp.]|nr:redoxin family protein [Hyphomicrobium sp.]
MASPQFNPETPPELIASQWFNAAEPLSLAKLKGKVVVLVAFQMLCPGSLRHSLPQASRIARAFSGDEVEVIGLHMVFENHNDMTPSLLEPFLKSEHIEIPVAVDAQNGSGLPQTMEAYGMQGTPTLLIFDRQGRLRRHYLGAVDDVRLGAEIMALAIEDKQAPREESIAIEQRLHAALVDPNEHHHHHHHDGECCGGHHHHEHAHDHDHDHEGGCCGGKHAHDHGHDHEAGCCGGHDRGHAHAHGEGCGCKH